MLHVAASDEIGKEDSIEDAVVEKGDGGQEEYTMEAAYAVQTMYALTGNAVMARDITEKYLVV
jgi:hypothetical protein